MYCFNFNSSEHVTDQIIRYRKEGDENMSKYKNYDKSKVLERAVPPRLRELCPKEKFCFADNTFYFVCILDEDAYPDTAMLTREFYNGRPMFKHLGIIEIKDIVKSFLATNTEKRDIAANMIEELCQLPEMKIEDMTSIIEAIFDKYKDTLKPICETYKLCYLLPTTCRALDIREYKRKPTVIKRADFVVRIVRYARNLITEEDVLKLNVWQEKVLPSIDPTDTVIKLSAVPVGEHEKELTSDRYTNKKGETIKVGRYIRMQKQVEKF